MIQLKQSVAARAPVRLLDATGAPVTGVLAAAVTATLYYSDGTSASVTASGNWFETASGGYQLSITPTVLGPVQLVVTVSGAQAFVGVYDVVADFASDAVTAANTANTTAGSAVTAANTAASAAGTASTSASGAAAAANAAQAAAVATLNAFTGGWTLDPVLNQLTVFSTDNVTVLAKFNCFDSSGNPSVTNVFKRVKV